MTAFWLSRAGASIRRANPCAWFRSPWRRWRGSGEADPSRHVIVARAGSRADLAGWGAQRYRVHFATAVSRRRHRRARTAIAEGQHGSHLSARRAHPQPSLRHCCTAPTRPPTNARYPFDISPVSDNRPFFFYTVQPRDLWNFVTQASTRSADYKINRAVPLLFELLGVSVLATLIILALPPLVLGARLPREKPVLRFLLYFLAIGAGYILIEVALIQKFVLFLGHPTYALTVVIFSMLVSSGLGSYLPAAAGHRILRRPVGAGDRWPALPCSLLTGGRMLPCCFRKPLALPLGLEDAAYGGADFPRRFRDGHAFSHRPGAPGALARAFGALGLVTECGGQRVWLGRRLGLRHLSRVGPDPSDWRPAVPDRSGIVARDPANCGQLLYT